MVGVGRVGVFGNSLEGFSSTEAGASVIATTDQPTPTPK